MCAEAFTEVTGPHTSQFLPFIDPHRRMFHIPGLSGRSAADVLAQYSLIIRTGPAKLRSRKDVDHLSGAWPLQAWMLAQTLFSTKVKSRLWLPSP